VDPGTAEFRHHYVSFNEGVIANAPFARSYSNGVLVFQSAGDTLAVLAVRRDHEIRMTKGGAA
jgi:hypothetical protein